MIDVHRLTRKFGRVLAVDGLDLIVAEGTIYGLIGPDGAGKTTTLRLLAGVLQPSGGSAVIAGIDVTRSAEALHHLVGYMPQHFSLYGDLSVLENLQFFADIYGVRGTERQERIEKLLHFARLLAFKSRPAAHLSGGMKKKLALACALIHQPRILLLDEPTNGVDPVSRREFWDILADLHLQGVTMLISTPYMDEAERCHQVGLMYNGRLIRQGTPADLRALTPGEMVAVYTSDLIRAEQALADYQRCLDYQVYGDRIHVFLQNAESEVVALRAHLQTWGVTIQAIRPDMPRLEEAFIHLMTHQLTPSRRSLSSPPRK